MKEKTTRKFLKENYHIINIGNQPMQTLFTFEDASYYCTRVEGWACDVYVFGDYVIVTGYDCPGKLIPYEITRKYEHKAYYFTPDNKYLTECIEDENWCKRIYEAFPENTRFRIERKVECYVEN